MLLFPKLVKMVVFGDQKMGLSMPKSKKQAKGVMDSSYMKVAGVNSSGLRLFLIFSDTLSFTSTLVQSRP